MSEIEATLKDVLNNQMDSHPILYAMGWKVLRGVYMGHKDNEPEGVEAIVHVNAVGQLMSAEGGAIIDAEGRLVISAMRLSIPLEKVSKLIEQLQKALEASGG